MSSTVVVSGQTSRTHPERPPIFPALNGLRACSFLLVFFAHYASLPWGWGGVNIFFVISGFLITRILWSDRNRPDRLRRFYVRRTLRIFPLYYGVFLLLLLLFPIFRWRWSLPWLAWPLYLGNFLRFWHGADPSFSRQAVADGWLFSRAHPGIELLLGHFWSLCVEEQFYLVWPFAVWAVRRRRHLLWICAAAVVVVPLLRCAAFAVAPAWVVQNVAITAAGVPFQIDALLLGALVGLLWDGRYREALFRLCRIGFYAFTMAFAIALCTQFRGGVHGAFSNYVYPAWLETWGVCLVNLYGACAVILCLRPGSGPYRILNQRWLQGIGTVSYGAYVFHDIPHILYWQLVALGGQHLHFLATYRGVATATLALTCTLALAFASYYGFESYFLNLKERWAA